MKMNQKQELLTSFYQELEQNYIPFHLQKLLTLLSDNQLHSTDEVIFSAGKQYNARIYELRRLGYSIISIRKDKLFYYYMESGVLA